MTSITYLIIYIVLVSFQLIKDFYRTTYTERYGSVSEGTITVLWSLTNAIFIPGGMAGAFLGGFIADRLGR